MIVAANCTRDLCSGVHRPCMFVLVSISDGSFFILSIQSNRPDSQSDNHKDNEKSVQSRHLVDMFDEKVCPNF